MLKKAIFLLALLLLAGCSFPGQAVVEAPAASPGAPGVPTRVEGTLQAPTETVLPSPSAVPRVLTVCTAAEPENLFVYAGRSLAKNHVLEAIYDGPIDSNGFDYQPVILEKLPALPDGDAVIEPVSVEAGDLVVNDAGELVPLSPGQIVRPFGCTQPGCAVAWEGGLLEMAQLSATFTLRAGMQWSDGTPLTAADSVFSFRLAHECQAGTGPCGGAGLASGNPDTAGRTANYTALDDRTVRWTGVPGFLDPDYRTNFFIPQPEHQLSQTDLAVLLEAGTDYLPLSWGPYMLERWVPGDHIRLLRNPTYFRADEGLPRFDVLVFQTIGQEPERNLAALFSGTCDLLDQTASAALLGDELQELLERDESGDLAAHFTTSTAWELVAFGLQPVEYDDGYQLGVDSPAIFSDARTRQAVALCMDRQRVVESLFAGQSAVAQAYLPEEHPLFNSEIARYNYDPQAGAALLQQVGWIDEDGDPETPRLSQGVPNLLGGTPLAFTYLASDSGPRRQAAEILATSLADCGMQVDLEFVDMEQLYAAGPQGPLFGRRFELAQLAWFTGIHPPCGLFTSDEIPGPFQANWIPFGTLETRTFRRGWGGVNATGWMNLEYDQACRAAQEALPGEPGYLESHASAQEIFAAGLPVVPLYWHTNLVVTRPDLCGFSLDPTARSELWGIEAFDQGEGCP